MTGRESASFSSLAMYPFRPLRAAWEALYATAAREVPEAPTSLRWDVEPHDSWRDPALVLGMACGWPLVTSLRGEVRCVGTFVYEIDGHASHLYRSVIVAREPASVADLADRVAAVNSDDSLSGHVSLLAALEQDRSEWPGGVVWTTAHVASIEAVRSGRADVASIDALTWAYLQRDERSSLDGLVVIGRGPTVPALPLIVSGDESDDVLTSWRQALGRAMHDGSLRDALDTLLIRGFVALDNADYETALSDLRARVT